MPFTSSRWFSTLLAVLSGVILVFAYPRWNIEAAVWLWVFPLLFVLWPLSGKPTPRKPFRLGYLAGLAFYVPNLFWLRHSSRVIAGAMDNTWIGLGPELLGLGAVVGLSLYCALYFGFWAWFVARFTRPDLVRIGKGTWQVSTAHSLRCAFLAAAAWVGLEWLRGILFTGFGWNGLAVALHQNTVLIQAADMVGVTGLSFLPIFVACCGYNAISRMVLNYRGQGTCKSRLDFTLAMIVLLSVAGYGIVKLGNPPAETIKVRTVLVQPNVPQVERWAGQGIAETYQKFADFTRLYAEARDGTTPVDLVIWPESALPFDLFGVQNRMGPGEHVEYFNSLLSLGDYSLLTGVDVLNIPKEPHTSVVLLRGQVDETFASAEFSHKVHLVAFGEFLPFREYPPFSFLRGVLPGDFVAGKKTDPLHLKKPEVQIIPLICFEDTVGRLARRFIRDAPQMLVNVTNDGWFLQSNETEVHLANAKFRTIELRRPMCRAANTGISCFIDTHGRVTSRLADPESGNTFIEGCLPGEVLVPANSVRTLYARYGDLFSITLLSITGLFGLWAWGANRKANRQAQP